MWPVVWSAVKENEAGWEPREAGGVLFQMGEGIHKGKWNRGLRARGAEPVRIRDRVGGRRSAKVDCHDWSSLWWRVEATGMRGSYWNQYGDFKENIKLVSLAQGDPGSSFRQMQVTILFFGLEKQCGFVLYLGQYSHEVFNDGKCKPAGMIPILPEGRTPVYVPGVAAGLPSL